MVWAEGGVQMMIALTMMLAAMLAAHPAQVSGTDPAFLGPDPQPRTESESPKKNNPTLKPNTSAAAHFGCDFAIK